MVHVQVAVVVAFVTNVLVVAQGECETLAELVGFALVMMTARKLMRHVEVEARSGSAVAVMVVALAVDFDRDPVAPLDIQDKE
jgi:hypothetical protein